MTWNKIGTLASGGASYDDTAIKGRVSALETGKVSSVNSKTPDTNGAVTLAPGDIGAATTAQGAKADSAIQSSDLSPYAKTSDTATAAQGSKADSAVQPSGLSAYAKSADVATAAQGAKADSAVQPTRKVAGKTLDADITLAPSDIGAATSAQGSKADSAVQPAGLTPYAKSSDVVPVTRTVNGKALSGDITLAAADVSAATAAQGAKADSAVQPTRKVAGKTLDADVTLAPSDVGAATAAQGAKADSAVQPTRKVAGKTLDADVSIAPSDIGAATAAQGAKADSAVQPSGLSSYAQTANVVPNTRTVNGKALSANVTLAASDVGAATTAQGAKADAAAPASSLKTVATSGSYTDLTNLPSLFQQFPTAWRRWNTAYAQRKTRQVNIVVLGDSISAGVGASSRATRWTRVLATSMGGRDCWYPVFGSTTWNDGATTVPSSFTQAWVGLNEGAGYFTSSGTDPIVWSVPDWATSVDIVYSNSDNSNSTASATITSTNKASTVTNWATDNSNSTVVPALVQTVALDTTALGRKIEIRATAGTPIIQGVMFRMATGVHLANGSCSGVKASDLSNTNVVLDPKTTLDMTVASIMAMSPDLVVVELGANDWVQGATAANAVASVKPIVDRLLAATNPPLVAVMPFWHIVGGSDTPQSPDTWAQFVQAQKDLVASYSGTVALLDLYAPSVDPQPAALIDQSDKTHPNDAGQQWTADVIKALLRVDAETLYSNGVLTTPEGKTVPVTSSVNGIAPDATGAVALTPASVGAATTAQGAKADAAAPASSLATVATTGNFNDLTNKPQVAILIDSQAAGPPAGTPAGVIVVAKA